MRGIGRTISRLSAARAVLAGAAILAGTALRPAQGEGSGGAALHPEETAMAVPRIHPPAGSGGIGLPQPLAPSEAARVRRIFALQRQGLIPAAIAETGRLDDTTLLGHILADRLLARQGRATAPALSDWLGRYADLPDACAIYALLRRKLPPGAAPPAAPASATLGGRGGIAAADTSRSAAGAARDAFLRGRDAAALRLGRAAFEQSHGSDGQAAYVAGLAAWRRGGFAASATLFEGASLAGGAGAGLRAGAAFWAARAHQRAGQPDAWRAWMLRAAAEPHTLHGMLARRMLGLGIPAAPASPTLAEADVEAIASTPQGRRAMALLQVGEPARAEAELRLLWPVAQANAPLSRALFLVAGAAGLSNLVADLSDVVDATEADLPVPILRPRGGYRLNPALVYAVARVESNFDTAAASGAGAQGLMQLMPVATGALGRPVSAQTLRDPGQNLRLGQAYLAYLSQPAIAGNDLLRVLASYNAGPGAVQRWGAAEADPVLFLETIPTDETRHFVQRALTNLWGYAARFATPAPSLDAMAQGIWPEFATELYPRRVSQRAVVRLH
jgi:soluble lytic murein transglycosylase-like protein